MIVILQHVNSKKQRQITLQEWDVFKETESGKVWKVVKRISYNEMEQKKFSPPEISEKEHSQPIIINNKKGAIAKADQDAKK